MIIQADILTWAATYDGPKFHALLCDALLPFCALYISVSTTVAGFAEGNKIRQLVRLFVPLHAKQSEGANVMHTLASRAAFLASVPVALQGLAALRRPIRAAIIVAAIDVLRMVQAMPVCITARARAVFTAALARFEDTFIYPKRLTTIKASEVLHFRRLRPRSQGCMLTRSGAMLSTPML